MSALELLATWPVPAAAGAVLHGDQVTDRAGPTDRPFPLASVTKFLAAIVCNIAVDEGSLDLDAPAGPEGSTVRHLLAHASGLGPDGESMAPVGDRRIYSNAGFELLAEKVEEATAMPFGQYAREALCTPLGLVHTDTDGSAAHAWTSSVDDLAAIVSALLGGRLLAPSSVERLATPTFPELAGVLPGYGRQEPNPWGLGVEVRGHKTPHWTSPLNSPATYGHFGRTGTFVWIDPVANRSLVVLTDRDFGQWAIDAWPVVSGCALDGAPT